ncbi:F0F1 ATP synthase subunit A [Pedobacter antarcticus]|uniref:ATP synthase subunit a n=2 Tax=Pedobacter antarcticus TaxID=34086 RepID=A0A081PK39_9SPHI|nr:F0F1 ATP synthase subunit A [Pedobacter antarcticus]KEQ31062.1 ATP synthase F0 subunit A [Pedobacter antarcticus 4BY]SDL99365.1 ATP synthase F0 subcomplex A subunit [Pedobacter antarcticus]SFF32231.1 F-type H+-transporting ATPase subunit a [Pedobacter antarcticus]
MDCSHVFDFKVNRLTVVFALFLAFFFVTPVLYAQEDTSNVTATAHAEPEAEKKFNLGKFALHHIADSHSWHVIGDTYIGLPVMLYTNTGLVVFNSNDFHHDDEAKLVVEKGGQRFVKLHEKIYYASEAANEHGQYVEVDENHHSLNKRPLDFSITKNVCTLFISVLVILAVFLKVANGYKVRKGLSPKGLQSWMEPIILFVRDDIAKPNLGHKYERFMPYLLTVFFFIWFNNMLGLIPFLPGGANLTGNIAVTVVLASITLILILVNGNKYYWKHIFAPDVPWWLYIVLVPVEIIGIFTKPIALAIRLFANITAGHILVLALIGLIFVFNSVYVSFVSVPFALFIGAIELLVAFIQAFIFTILSALFIGMAIEEHH